MHMLFLSCLKATELIEKNLHFKLSFREKLQLKVHKMMCDACSNYGKQNFIIEMGIATQESIEIQKLDINFDSFKKSIIDKIEKQ